MKIVVFTGAGISAESGIQTFRDSNGLWATYRIEDVCTPEALRSNRDQVIEFYNMRRKEALSKHPNEGHFALVELERYFDVEIITQNIDDLHERAGSSRVTHLHGEIRKLRSSIDEGALVEIEGWEQPRDTRHADGSLLRPHVVFFGESVPMMDVAVRIVSEADLLIVVGTSLKVYPAASLLRYVAPDVPVYIVDPNKPDVVARGSNIHFIVRPASTGLPKLVKELIATYDE